MVHPVLPYSRTCSIYGGNILSVSPSLWDVICVLSPIRFMAWSRVGADSHFIVEETMLEVDCSVLTPYIVLKTSGHVDKFADWMCKDSKTGDIIRADHFVEDVLEARLKGDKEARGQKLEQGEQVKDAKRAKKKAATQEAVKLEDAVVEDYQKVLAQIDNYNGEELGDLIKKYDLRYPLSGSQPSPPVAFNLMFQTSVGPSANLPSYLRPETAQGQFMNFAKVCISAMITSLSPLFMLERILSFATRQAFLLLDLAGLLADPQSM